MFHCTPPTGQPTTSTLFVGGTVVSMDPDVGVLPQGDVLVQGSQIAAIGSDLRHHPRARDATIIDVAGCIVSPGFVDTHRHAWETQFRRSIPDVADLGAYVMSTLAELAPRYTPHDMYVGTRLAALSAIDAGITTMLDFSHNSRSSAHSDAALDALIDSGIRGVHAAMGPHFGDWDRQWPADLTRLRGRASGLVSAQLAALATAEIAGHALSYGPELAAVARDLDIRTNIDAVFGTASSESIVHWAREGLLDPTLTLIHCTGLTVDAWQAMAHNGVSVSLAPTSDAQIGLETAVPAIDEALMVGIRPGLSIDVEVALVSDMFTQMRTLHAIQRMRAVNSAYGPGGTPAQRITTGDVLDFATLQGARTIGLNSVTGSLTAGKQADLVVVRANDVNNMPLNDAIGTLVLGTDTRNIVAVLIAGCARKWNGALVDVDIDVLRREVTASRDAVLAR